MRTGCVGGIRVTFSRALAAAAVLLATGLAGRGASLYVALDGNGANDGTWAGAFTNVQSAINAASPGDTIHFKGETFVLPANSPNGKLVWGADKPNLTLAGGYQGTGPEPGPLTNTPTVLRNTAAAAGGTNRILYLSGVTNGVLRRVTIRGGEAGNRNAQTLFTDQYGGGLYMTACTNMLLDSVVLDGNYIGGQQSKLAYGFGAYAANSFGTMTNCVFRNNTAFGLWTTWYGGGLHLAGGGWVLGDCVLRDNGTLDRSDYQGNTYGMGLYINGGNHVVVNTLFSRNYGYTSFGKGEALYVAAGNVGLRNVTAAFHPHEGVRLAGGTIGLTNSILWGNGMDLIGVATARVAGCDIGAADRAFTAGGVFSANPLFERGFYLATNSPCVDAGTVDAAAAGLSDRTTRADGAADGGAVDLGYHAAAGVAVPDLYVSVNAGSDANSGTNAASPLKSIGRALALAGDGTHVRIEAGVYGTNTESFPIVASNLFGLRLIGTNAALTVLTPAGTANRALTMRFCYPDASVENLSVTGVNHRGAGPLTGGALNLVHAKALLTGLIVRGNRSATTAWSDPAVLGGAIYLARSEGVLSNSLVYGNSATHASANENGARLGAGVYCDGGWSFVNSEFAFNTNYVGGSFSYLLAGGGLYLTGVNLLRSCLIRSNECNGTGAWLNRGDGLYVGGGTTIVENCTIAGNGGVGIDGGATATTATNTLLWGNGDDLTGAVTLAYCDVEDGDFAGLNGNRSVDPQFTGVYRLAYGSPCVNAGTNRPWMAGARDLDGNSRIRNGFVDIGASEAFVPLAVTNLAATGVSAGSATLNGRLLSDGEAAPAAVTLYWGPVDQGMTADGWTGTNYFGGCPEQADLATNVVLDPPSGAYAYRFFASNAAGATAWAHPAAGFTILDVRLEAADPDAAEDGPDTGAFRVTRSVTTADPLTVNFTVGGTAVEGTDYAPVGASVVIPGNASNATVTVTPLPDRVRGEGAETVTLALAPGSYIIHALSNAAVTIADWTPPAYACVAGGGDATYGTNWATAYTNIQAVLDASVPGDVLYLAGGTYALPAPLTLAVSDRTLSGGYAATGSVPGAWSDATPTILTRTGGVMRIAVIGAVSNVTLERLTIRDGLQSGGHVYGAGLHIQDATNVMLASVRFLGNQLVHQQGCNAWGGGLYAVRSWGVISNGLFRDNRSSRYYDVAARGAGACLIGGGWTVRDSVFRDNLIGYAFQAANIGTAQGAGLFLSEGRHELRNVLIAGNMALTPIELPGSLSQGDGLYVQSGTCAVWNATVGYHLAEGVRLAGGELAITNAILSGSPRDCAGVSTASAGYCVIGAADRSFEGIGGNRMLDPGFERGYFLAGGSPCLDAGSGPAADQGLGFSVTRADGTPDTGTVDLGYHAPEGVPADRRDLYVWADSPAASDANAGGGWDLPLKTISQSLRLAVDGTRIHVGSGQYTNGMETFPLALTNRLGLQLLGNGATSTVISAAGVANARVLQLGLVHPDGAVEGVTLTGGRWGGNNMAGVGAGLYAEHCRGRVAGCVMSGNVLPDPGGWGVPAGAGIGIVRSALVVSNCVVRGNSATSWFADHCYAGGVYASEAGPLVNCVIEGNTAYGGSDAYNAFSLGAGLTLEQASIRGCLVSSNDALTGASAFRARGDGIYVPKGTVAIENCTIAGNGGEGVRGGGGGPTLVNSIAWGNGDDATGVLSAAYSIIGTPDAFWTNGVNGMSDADPLFADAAGGDYRLRRGSPAVDAGTNAAWMAESTDLAGLPRLKNRRVDLGAYEMPFAGAGTVIMIR